MPPAVFLAPRRNKKNSAVATLKGASLCHIHFLAGFVFSYVALSLLLAALCVAQQKSDTPKNGVNKFNNVKILKNLSKDDLLAVMRKFDNDLGVRCEYCHVMKKFRFFEDCYKDDKPPNQQARKMLLMTRDLNKHYAAVQKKVSCWTYHAGIEQPVNTPPP